MKIQIKCRFTAKLLFECEADSMKVALRLAIEKKVDLNGANLTCANLYGANLNGANLNGANLNGANLNGANLYGANLYGANLNGANLNGANLTYANLTCANLYGANLNGANLNGANLNGANLNGANLTYANLTCANLYGANLNGANLNGANLTYANLNEIKKDFFMRLSLAKAEAVGLYKAHMEGRVDGSVYSGECACFVGTIANVRGVKSGELEDLIGLPKEASSPTEKWYLSISKGMTEGNAFVDITLGWIREWAKENHVKLPTRKVVWK